MAIKNLCILVLRTEVASAAFIGRVIGTGTGIYCYRFKKNCIIPFHSLKVLLMILNDSEVLIN